MKTKKKKRKQKLTPYFSDILRGPLEINEKNIFKANCFSY